MDKKKDKKKKKERSNQKKAEIEVETQKELTYEFEPTGTVHTLTTAECPIISATVYSDRAEVTRKIKISATKEGAQDVIVTGFPTSVNEKSFRVAGADKNVLILEVSYSVVLPPLVPLKKKEDDPDWKKYKAKLKDLLKKKQVIQAQQNRLNEQRTWLKNYSSYLLTPSSTSTTTKEPSLEQASKFLSFYNQELKRLDDESFAISVEVEENESEIALVNSHINLLNTDQSDTKREVTITLGVLEKGDVELSLSYVVNYANWKSSYDVRVDTIKKSIVLIYHGIIVNNSGEEWKDVSLALSTAAPSVGGEPPRLFPLLVSYGPAPGAVSYANLSESESDQDSVELKHSRRYSVEYSPSKPSLSPVSAKKNLSEAKLATSQVEQGSTSATYRVHRKSTILSDNKPHKVVIAQVELNAKFEYVAVPKKSDQVFLKALATNNSNYTFLQGPINVFMNNYFVTTSQITTTAPGESFKLYLGNDASIKIDFKPISQNEAKTGIITKSKSVTSTHTTVITNNKMEEVEVLVFQQLPFSKDEKIKVSVKEPNIQKDSDVSVDEYSLLKWRVKIKPGAEAKLRFSYLVEHPADKDIVFIPQVGNNSQF
eukprot:TRINITY_DN5488_c0_g1_i1.p1 TRINITY_DN5488_c0_g1~~TRINITY_DN5488_c0_g1_i1.p1  ORF type:complete len:599 (+),score=130.40 TRINITY_DN5488_c0_g1_i1:55-1851(+)